MDWGCQVKDWLSGELSSGSMGKKKKPARERRDSEDRELEAERQREAEEAELRAEIAALGGVPPGRGGGGSSSAVCSLK